MPMCECTHPPCPWTHRYRRQRDHFVPSSTPFLARFGLEALATVRVEEDTGAVPRSVTGSNRLGAQRAQFQQRAVGAQPPVRTFCQILWTQGRRESRALTAPAAPCARSSERVHTGLTGTAETSRLSPRNGFTAYTCSPR